jgi:hypothetical protein
MLAFEAMCDNTASLAHGEKAVGNNETKLMPTDSLRKSPRMLLLRLMKSDARSTECCGNATVTVCYYYAAGMHTSAQ